MVKEFKTIESERTAELTQKKSKFIATILPVTNEGDACRQLQKIKQRYYDARHNCFAFCIIQPKEEVVRFSDDGEPSGTAGAPLLNILKKNNLHNVMIVVTRYFGGILLGTGGLVRAYTNTAMLALEKANVIEKEIGEELEIILSYTDFEKFEYYCKKNNINITNTLYNEKVTCMVDVNEQEKKEIIIDNDNNKFNVLHYEIKCKKYIRKTLKNQ